MSDRRESRTARLGREKAQRQRQQLGNFGPAGRTLRNHMNADHMDSSGPGRLSGRIGPVSQSGASASSSSSSTAGHAASGGSRNDRNRSGQRPITTTVKVEGFSGTVNEKDLVAFIRRHVAKALHVNKYYMEGGVFFISVNTAGEAQAIAKLGRQQFNKDTITFCLHTESRVLIWSEEKRQHLIMFLQTRFQLATQILDLSGMKSDMDLSVAHIVINFNNTSFVAALLKLVNELMPDLVGLRVANNEIQQLSAFSQIHLMLPKLTLLDLSNNQITSLKQLDFIKNFKNLRQLLLINNPLMNNIDMSSMKSDLARKFPALQMLNNEMIQSMQFAVPTEVVDAPLLPKESDNNFFDCEETAAATELFLQKYLAIYDSGKRDDLLPVYSDKACFSIVTIRTPQRHGLREAPAPDYVRSSRNLKMENIVSEGKEWERRVKLVQHGPSKIINFIKDLPRTSHPLETCRVSSWQHTESQPPLLFIFFHGDFLELKTGNSAPIKRSFDRTFTLMPAPANSLAMNAGWMAQIVNDQITVRSYSARFGSIADTASVPAVNNTPAMAAVQPGGPGLSPAGRSNEQSILVQQLMQATGLGQEFAFMCLAENNMDINQALATFQQLHASGKIPPNYFVR